MPGRTGSRRWKIALTQAPFVEKVVGMVRGGVYNKPEWLDIMRAIPPNNMGVYSYPKWKKAPKVQYPEDHLYKQFHRNRPMMKWETKFLSSETVSISQRFAQEQWKLMNTKDLSELQAYKACEQKFRNEIEQFEINVCGHFEQLKDEDHVATGYGKDDLALGEANMKHLKRNISTDSITPEQSARLATELSKEPPSLTSLLEPPPLTFDDMTMVEQHLVLEDEYFKQESGMVLGGDLSEMAMESQK